MGDFVMVLRFFLFKTFDLVVIVMSWSPWKTSHKPFWGLTSFLKPFALMIKRDDRTWLSQTVDVHPWFVGSLDVSAESKTPSVERVAQPSLNQQSPLEACRTLSRGPEKRQQCCHDILAMTPMTERLNYSSTLIQGLQKCQFKKMWKCQPEHI